jgi:hypothetical protein
MAAGVSARLSVRESADKTRIVLIIIRLLPEEK